MMTLAIYFTLFYRFDLESVVNGCFSEGMRQWYYPSSLAILLSHLPKLSREEAPVGSQLPFGQGDIVLRLNPYPSDYGMAFAFSDILYPLPHGPSLRLACSSGETASGLPCSSQMPEWGGLRPHAGETTSAAMDY